MKYNSIYCSLQIMFFIIISNVFTVLSLKSLLAESKYNILPNHEAALRRLSSNNAFASLLDKAKMNTNLVMERARMQSQASSQSQMQSQSQSQMQMTQAVLNSTIVNSGNVATLTNPKKFIYHDSILIALTNFTNYTLASDSAPRSNLFFLASVNIPFNSSYLKAYINTPTLKFSATNKARVFFKMNDIILDSVTVGDNATPNMASVLLQGTAIGVPSATYNVTLEVYCLDLITMNDGVGQLHIEAYN